MDDKMVWLLGVLVVMAAMGLLMLYGELQNARKKEAVWLRSSDSRRNVQGCANLLQIEFATGHCASLAGRDVGRLSQRQG